MDIDKSTFSTAVKDFYKLTYSPELFIEQALTKTKGLQNVAKKFHQHSVEANSLTRLKANSLSELLVDGFDEEQVWQQIELQNKSAAFHLHSSLSKLVSNGYGFGVSTENVATGNESLDHDDLSDAQSLSNDEDQDNFSDDANESDDVDFEGQDQLSDGEDSDEDMEIEKPKSILKKSAKKIVQNSDNDGGKSPTVDHSEKNLKQRKYKCGDDQFFKLSKLTQFLRAEDLKEERARDGVSKEDKESDEELSDDEDIDLFQDVLSDDLDESGDEEITNKKSSRELMYEDFFDAPDSGDENMNEDETSDLEQNDDLNDEMDLFKDKEGSEEDKDLQTKSYPDKDSKQIPKTPFQLEQEKVKQQIEEYEGKMLKPAAWHLTGEVDSSARPIDALLHLQTDFELNAKPVIIQDKPLCEKLESMLKMTIKNKSFSDGVKQSKTNDEIIAKKKEVVIEETKSKKSLTQEYEDMYLKKKHGQEEVENPKHKEIKKLMDSLFPELHALFSHIPKPAIPDIKIVSNLPAISLEEVAPTSVSDVTLLAPEEVKKRTGVVKGTTERTDVDRKQERRKKKFLQKMKQRKREKESSDKPLSAKAQKREKIDMIRKLKQQRNTKFAKTDGQKVKSSKDFFERLQDTVSTTVNKMQAKKKS